jgi:PhnB protein
VVDGGQRAIEFYGRAFGAEVVTRLTMGDKLMHAEVRIGDSTFTLSDEFPDYGFVAPASDSVSQSLLIWVEDVDAAHARTVEAGATQTSEVSDQFHGDRVGTVRCPLGHRWVLATHTEDLSEAEMQRRMEEVFDG